jgi:sugar (pentulose or hexulose) kinase
MSHLGAKVASGFHRAVACTLFGASVVGSGALLVTFGQSMVRLARVTPAAHHAHHRACSLALTAGGCMLWCAQAKFQEHKRVSQMYQLQLDEEKRAVKGGAEAPANPLDK